MVIGLFFEGDVYWVLWLSWWVGCWTFLYERGGEGINVGEEGRGGEWSGHWSNGKMRRRGGLKQEPQSKINEYNSEVGVGFFALG